MDLFILIIRGFHGYPPWKNYYTISILVIYGIVVFIGCVHRPSLFRYDALLTRETHPLPS
jgi:hypothetical protein